MAYSIERMPERISIGRETETGVTDVMIDCGAWVDKWPGMELHAIYTPEGGAPYILQTETDGGVLVWHVTDADTATPGTGSMEIVGEMDGRRKVSATVKVSVAARMSGTVGEPPEAAKPWADRVVEAAERITGMKVQAETLDAGSGATAAWDGEQGLLTIGVPKGEKGEKGPQGEKGEPGKDAVVDATLTQSGQAADAKVTGEAMACKLTEPSSGLAVGKYFRIAAIDEAGHAVLEAVDAPVGGLSTEPRLWPAWTSDEQAAARERMGLPGDYELIEEITLEEAVNAVDRSTEPDGTSYNFCNMFVKTYAPGDTYTATMNVRYYYGEIASIIAYISSAVGTGDRYGISKAEEKFGYLEAYGSTAGSSNTTVILSLTGTTYNEYMTRSGAIKRLAISLQGAKLLPVGSKIQIYGVRA